ncbi:peptidoglycan binding protein CsiV [Shewanella sp. YIC-542]|uniref:peptidoglycan binding protein CsiV n=1 Tax=Shewanella mytili TaxID=3377111 RepID=UPI00398ECB99
MFNKFLLATLTTCLLSASLHAVAAPWYEVEIYLFQRPLQTQQEHWPDTPLPLDTRNAIDLLTPQVASDITGVSMALNDCNSQWNGLNTTSQPCDNTLESAKTLVMPQVMPVDVLPKDPQSATLPHAVLEDADSAQFGEIIARLQRQSGAEPLLHITWRQEMKPRRQSRPLHLFAGRNFAEQFQHNGLPVSQQVAVKDRFATFDALKLEEKTTPVWQFDGLLNIYLSHYLYVETRFNLRQPGQKSIAIEGHPATEMPYLYSMPMEQNRRIRSTEIHYFDHPAMGMILQVRRIQQPDDTTTETPTDAEEPAATSPAADNPPDIPLPQAD